MAVTGCFWEGILVRFSFLGQGSQQALGRIESWKWWQVGDGSSGGDITPYLLPDPHHLHEFPPLQDGWQGCSNFCHEASQHWCCDSVALEESDEKGKPWGSHLVARRDSVCLSEGHCQLQKWRMLGLGEDHTCKPRLLWPPRDTGTAECLRAWKERWGKRGKRKRGKRG